MTDIGKTIKITWEPRREHAWPRPRPQEKPIPVPNWPRRKREPARKKG